MDKTSCSKAFCSCAGYKWVVGVAACVTLALTIGFIAGTASLLSIYYEQQYKERALSSNIAALQASISYFSTLPMILLKNKIGERYTQIIGGILTVVSLLGTAFTTEAWQGMLTSGVLFGLGSACGVASAYSMMASYFYGEQLVPSVILMASYKIAAASFPSLIGYLMSTVGFQYTFIVCASLMSLNIVAGILFQPKALPTEEEQNSTKHNESPKLTLKFPGKKAGVYNMAGSRDAEETFYTESDAAAEDKSINAKKPFIANSFLSLLTLGMLNHDAHHKEEEKEDSLRWIMQYNARLSVFMSQLQLQKASSTSTDTDSVTSSETSEPAQTLYDTISKAPGGGSIANLVAEKKTQQPSIRKLVKNPAVINFLIAAFLTSAGFVSFDSLVSDYSNVQLGYPSEQLTLGFTVQGVSQLVTAVLFAIMAHYVIYASTFVFVAGVLGSAGVTFYLAIGPQSIEYFYGLMGAGGVFRTIYLASVFGVCLELTSPSQSVLLFTMESFVNGCGGLTFPYLASYLQVNVDIRGGLYLAGALQALAAISLIPLGIKYLMRPKTYTPSEEEVRSTDFVAVP